MPVEQAVAIVAQDADIYAARMEIDPAIRFVLCGGKSPKVSSSPS
jgi:hypothetical protein